MSQAAVVVDEKVLIKMRRVMGLKQIEAAHRAGIERSRFSRWESGLIELNPEELKSVADLIAEVSLERSEMATLPQADDVSSDSRQQGKKFQELRLGWGVKQKDVVSGAGLPDNLLSMWENGYVTMEPEEIERLNQSLLRLIDKQTSQLEWCLMQASAASTSTTSMLPGRK